MANSHNEIDQGSYGGNSSLPPASGPGISPTDPSLGDIGVTGPDTVLGAGTPIPIPAPDQTGGLAVLNPLLCEQLRQFIMDTINSAIRGSQASGIGPSSQAERGGTPTSQCTGEQAPWTLARYSPFYGFQSQRDNMTPSLNVWQSLEREVMKLRQQVTRDTLPTERGVPFSEHIMAEELPAHFRAPAHLLIYDGSTDPAEHIRKFENAALLHRYTDYIKCRIFLTTLTGSAQHWFDHLPAGSVRSFAEFSSLFHHQFASGRKYRKSAISLFGIKQQERETLRAYVQHFNTTILEIPAPY
ncbi:UNVERIFIED_CONTAM: hypothetical protein Slati_2902600 [Sesamum latifolium]|uniref:Retrotransposon gag domain-containing protein n=1 Tax=Sesamum latifolium TaxID=2727402 RepID=A0AAW2VDU5_9LAMI